MVEIELSQKQVADWLYYETGFEQLHPHLDIIEWMEEQGYKYHQDWDCSTQYSAYPSGSSRHQAQSNHYILKFSDERVATTFLLKWS